MQKQGTIVRWNAERAFGFIQGDQSTADVFFHLRDYRGDVPPREGMPVIFEEIHVGGKGPRGMAVQPKGHRAAGAQRPPVRRQRAAARLRRSPPETPAAPGSGALFAVPLMIAYACLMVWGVWTRQLPWSLLLISFLLNMFTFFAYWQDKYAAEKGRWRIAEDTLHLWSLAGGWGGAWFAQQVLRHKSRKASFLMAYRATALAHCAALAGWLFWLGPLWRLKTA